MADISKITLPSGNTYDIKDATARQMISGGISFNIVWTQTDYESTTAPSSTVLSTIPYGVTVYYNNGSSSALGTLLADADTTGKFYLIYSKTSTLNDIYSEYVTISEIEGGVTLYSWEKIGDTEINLSNVVTDVTLNKQTTDFVTGYSSPTSDTFVKSVTAETNKNLVTSTASKATASTNQTTATGVGTASSLNTNWLKGISVANEILTIGAATMNTQTTTQFTFTDVTVATGETSTTGTGDAVVTGVTIGSSASAITALGTPTTAQALNNTTSLTVTKGSN